MPKNVLKLQLQISSGMIHFVEFGSRKIEFTVKYTARKTFGIKVSPDKTVHVSVPIETSMEEIEKWVVKKATWIFKQQHYFNTLELYDINYEIKSGYSVFYLGRQYKIIIEISKKEEVSYLGNQFLILVKKKENAPVIFGKWLKERAIQKISEIALPLMKKFEKNYKVPSKIHFQEMPTRWGSCTVKNKLIFNPRLIHVPRRCIEYVIMHELCHLIHKHHNKDFFDFLTLKMPDWENRKQKLDQYK
ncbi:M48 family metallopeptidase [Chryseobacterium binzhouense]|uniref:M48 family metallopeptidase n=1 Tax=Chryseobacterium binzhouense TaxID=2593646 RepID=UPI00289F2A4F|nr:SprT family zinc-dependent metalloprotease [Chryseobacterium binzhouense]